MSVGKNEANKFTKVQHKNVIATFSLEMNFYKHNDYVPLFC